MASLRALSSRWLWAAVLTAIFAAAALSVQQQEGDLWERMEQVIAQGKEKIFNVQMGIQHKIWKKDPPRESAPVGRELREAGYKPKFPVLIVPGFVTSGLELWAGKECAKQYFRRQLWGSSAMAEHFFKDTKCWLEHMTLHQKTGMDPEGIKLRSAQGFSAIDYFMPGYHVWQKLLENLADLGYDSNNLVTETYDWRLATPLLEKRDKYFSRLRDSIRTLHSNHDQKVVVMSHSWGDNVFRNFLHWITDLEPDFAEQHLEAYLDIAGPILGVPKSFSALLSGETRETAGLGILGNVLSDKLVSRKARTQLFRSWGAAMGMLPIGGPSIWGNATWSPEDTPEMTRKGISLGPMLTWRELDEARDKKQEAGWLHWLSSFVPDRLGGPKLVTEHPVKDEAHPLGLDDAMEVLIKAAGPPWQAQLRDWGAIHAMPPSEKKEKGCPTEAYMNPLKCPLPKAPSMTFYCMYGVGAPAERGYNYLKLETDEAKQTEGTHIQDREMEGTAWKIHATLHDEEKGIELGLKTADGDGTVPLISSGLMCKHPQGYRGKRLNPGGIRMVNVEYPHKYTPALDMRGGPTASTHVEILANDGFMKDALRIVAGDKLDDKIHSAVDELVSKIDLEADLRPEPQTSWTS